MTESKKAQAVGALRECAKEHEKDFTPTFNIRVSDLCNDVADYLVELQKENKELRNTLDLVTASYNKEVEELKVALKKYHCKWVHSVMNDDGAAVPCYSYNDCKNCCYETRKIELEQQRYI